MVDRLILVGGGLANGLLAYRLAQTRPELETIVLEQGARIGGNHTWSFHESDVNAKSLQWLQPFIVHRWPGQYVQFSTYDRVLETPYCSVTSERFATIVHHALGHRIKCGAHVKHLSPEGVVLSDGTGLEASAIIDGRGFPSSHALDLAWQKFHGLEIETTVPHGRSIPTIMDATVPQIDGFRFMYVLPFSPTRLLIEDTRYSETPVVQKESYANAIIQYAKNAGLDIKAVNRSETGALPLALGGDIDSLFQSEPLIARAGLAAGLFHPLTGYSLPNAVALADLVADLPDLSAKALSSTIYDHAKRLWRRRSFFRMLNRMLFRAAAGADRHLILQHFYHLPDGLVERFYADRLTAADKMRILVGRPPVPMIQAIRAAFTHGVYVKEAKV